MIRRINYTRRLRIQQSRIEIEIYDADDFNDVSFSARLDLRGMNLPSDASLIVEAKRERSSLRFGWGTIADPQQPSDTRLTDMPPNPSFRVMVVAADASGHLLALADNVRPRRGDSGAESLLWMEPADLGQEVWRLDFGEYGNPTMFVNKTIPGMSEAVRRDDAFRALVIPEVLRSILTRAIIVDDYDPDDGAGQWSEWLFFVSDFYHVDLPPTSRDHDGDVTAKLDWIDDVVEAFTYKRFHASDQYSTSRSQ